MNIKTDFVSADELRNFMKERDEISRILEKIHPEIFEAARRGEHRIVYPYHINGNDVEVSRKLGKMVEEFLMNKGYKALVQYDSIGFSITVKW